MQREVKGRFTAVDQGNEDLSWSTGSGNERKVNDDREVDYDVISLV